MGSLGTLVTLAYYYEEVGRFRDVMCSTRYTEEQKQAAFDGLSMVYLNFHGSAGDEAKVMRSFEATSVEFVRRQILDSQRPGRRQASNKIR